MLHRDSLGSEQLIRPGQVNLMTAGRGVVHAEENTGTYRGTLQGMQATVQPGVTTFGLRPDFEHAIIALDGQLLVGDERAAPRTADGAGRSPLPGAGPLWWNFVARSADEVSTFYADWRDRAQRFGEVDSRLGRIPAPPPPWEPIRTSTPPQGVPPTPPTGPRT